MSESRCPLCEVLVPRRIRCNICKRLICRMCIWTTAKDMGGPLCRECDPGSWLKRESE
jgi:hypothetical protein